MAAEVGHRGLRKYLLPGETPVAEIRHHRIVLLKPFAITVAALALVVWLDISVSDAGSAILPYLWWAWLAVVGWAAWQWIEWRHTRVVATDKRIVLFEGWINHKVSMMPLKKVTDMGYERSLLGRILGYGTFVLESAGQDQALSRIDHVPNSDENYRKIIAEIFGVSDESAEEEGEYVSEEEAAWETEHDVPDPTPLTSRRPRYADDTAYGPHVLRSTRRPTIYRSSDRGRRKEIDDTGELPPYKPDWRP